MVLPLAQCPPSTEPTASPRTSQDPEFPNPLKTSARVPLPGLGPENWKCQLHTTWAGLPRASPFILLLARYTPLQLPGSRLPPLHLAVLAGSPGGPHGAYTSPSSKQLPGLAGVGRHVLSSTHHPTRLGVMAAWRRLMALRSRALLLFLI